MREVRASDEVVLSWDGHALEVFERGYLSTNRFHREQIEVTQEGPDRKGKYGVKIMAKGGGKMRNPSTSSRVDSFYVKVDESQAPAVLDLIEEVNAASGD